MHGNRVYGISVPQYVYKVYINWRYDMFYDQKHRHFDK